MKNTPVDYQTARKIIDGYGLPDFRESDDPRGRCHIHTT